MPVTTLPTDGAVSTSKQELQLLVFELHGEEFAVNLTDAREIIRQMTLTEVPSAPATVRGILNLRGKVVTVVDLASLLGFSASEEAKNHIIVSEMGSEIYGVLVNTVTGVLRIPGSELKHTPSLLESKVQSAHVRGALIIEPTKKSDEMTVAEQANGAASVVTRVILVLDLPAILASLTSHERS